MKHEAFLSPSFIACVNLLTYYNECRYACRRPEPKFGRLGLLSLVKMSESEIAGGRRRPLPPLPPLCIPDRQVDDISSSPLSFHLKAPPWPSTSSSPLSFHLKLPLVLPPQAPPCPSTSSSPLSFHLKLPLVLPSQPFPKCPSQVAESQLSRRLAQVGARMRVGASRLPKNLRLKVTRPATGGAISQLPLQSPPSKSPFKVTRV
jgi:hypothetical protein